MPVPPKLQQERFEERCLSIQSIVAQQTEAFRKAEAIFRALLARAFSGDLAAAPEREAAVA